MGDEEAQILAADFVAVLRTAGWNTGSNDGKRCIRDRRRAVSK
jgi:hypothetical protein